ncbi:hypothetical protein [Streptomyces sp. NPDC006134]|uniref:hypothetical protein n=1 Tax=Streptomyces sp. NPDC006134 TaxID=3154467 RepID=UPI0033DC7DC6
MVGALVGLVGHRSNGARIGGAVVAALGAFFGYTNALLLIIAESSAPTAILDTLGYDPFFPAKAWWTDETGGGADLFSPLGLLVAAAAAWGLAHVVGDRHRRA